MPARRPPGAARALGLLTMRTVTYQTVLEGLLRMRGEEPAQAQLGTRLAMAEYLDQAMGACWEFWRWPELVLLEQRYFRPPYVAATAYAAGAEVYHPASQAYYRALKSTTGNAPAALSGGVYVVEGAYWWPCRSALAGADWANGIVYAVGDQVRNPANGLYYACHTAHTANTPSLDGGKFGEIGAWRPYVPYEQAGQTAIEAVIEAWGADPRSEVGALKLDYRLDADGVRFAADAVGPVWLEYRQRAPSLAWTAQWSASSWAAGAIVYDAATGGVYRASGSAVAGDVPGTAAVWVRQEVPYIFRNAAKYKAYGLWLEANGKTDAALVWDHADPAQPGRCQQELEEQVWQYTKLQGQTGRPTVRV